MFPRSRAGPHERRVSRQARTHHGGRIRAGNILRDREHEILMHTTVGAIPSLREDLLTRLVFHGLVATPLVLIVGRIIGIDHVGAVVLLVLGAVLALETGLYLCAHADAVAGFHAEFAVFADAEHAADDFVADT